MKRVNRLHNIHRIFGALFSIYYVYLFVNILLTLFTEIRMYSIPSIIEVILLVLYFSYMGYIAYRKEESRTYPILYLIVVGLLILNSTPTFLAGWAGRYIGFFFLIAYSYLYRTRSQFANPMSFIAFGFLIARLGLLAPIGYALIIYGWVSYALKKPVRY